MDAGDGRSSQPECKGGSEMDMRELKGLELAARAKIVVKDGAWIVPSQTTDDFYRVTLIPRRRAQQDGRSDEERSAVQVSVPQHLRSAPIAYRTRNRAGILGRQADTKVSRCTDPPAVGAHGVT